MPPWVGSWGADVGPRTQYEDPAHWEACETKHPHVRHAIPQGGTGHAPVSPA